MTSFEAQPYEERRAANTAVAPHAHSGGVASVTDGHRYRVEKAQEHVGPYGSRSWVVFTEAGVWIVGPRGGTTRVA